MKEITLHKCTGLNDLLHLEAADDEDRDTKQHHKYQVYVRTQAGQEKGGRVEFHKGPFGKNQDGVEYTPNGISEELLVAILIDRLRTQISRNSNFETSNALQRLEEALFWLKRGK